MANIGFIGLGIMGTPMAGHLLAGGHALFVYDVADLPKDVLDAGATSCASSKEVAEKGDIIIVMVPDTPHVNAVLFGENGVAEGLSKGKTVVDMSSISPIETKEFAKKINDLGCDYLDAPVSGGEVGAKAASLDAIARRVIACWPTARLTAPSSRGLFRSGGEWIDPSGSYVFQTHPFSPRCPYKCPESCE